MQMHVPIIWGLMDSNEKNSRAPWQLIHPHTAFAATVFVHRKICSVRTECPPQTHGEAHGIFCEARLCLPHQGEGSETLLLFLALVQLPRILCHKFPKDALFLHLFLPVFCSC